MDYQVNGTFHKNKQLVRESRTAWLVWNYIRTPLLLIFLGRPIFENCRARLVPIPILDLLVWKYQSRRSLLPKISQKIQLVSWSSTFLISPYWIYFTHLRFVLRWKGTHNRKWIVCLGQRLSSPQQQHISRHLRWSLFCSMGEPFFRFI